MRSVQRVLSNLFGGWFQLHRHFPTSLLDELAVLIGAGERDHLGEIRLAIEPRLNLAELLEGVDATTRAREVFSQLRVWDTERNSGVLLYVLMAERRIEVVADRGIDARVAETQWREVCRLMSGHFATGHWREGCVDGIQAVHALLTRHFPADDQVPPRDELGDRPALL